MRQVQNLPCALQLENLIVSSYSLNKWQLFFNKPPAITFLWKFIWKSKLFIIKITFEIPYAQWLFWPSPNVLTGYGWCPSQRVSNEERDSMSWWHHVSAGPLFTKRADVLPQDLAQSRSRKFGCYNCRIARECNSHLGSVAADEPGQSDWRRLNPNLAASRLHEISRQVRQYH